jgi:guanine deaminase
MKTMTAKDNKEVIMKEAIELSLQNITEGLGGPFAALIVRNGRIISRGTNLVTSANDPTAHAEMIAIRKACNLLETFILEGCEIYTTCEPCPMCLGAIYWARLDRIYYANSRVDAAQIGFDDKLIYQEIPLPHSQRKIPAIRLMEDQALIAFREWDRKQDKTRY